MQIADPDSFNDSPALRITPERVRRYIDSLIGLNNSTASVIARLRELGEVARVLAPDLSWVFINIFESRIRARHKPARDKRNLKLSDELLGLGLSLIDKAAACSGREAALLHRDGLMIALLALVPLRRCNFGGLRLGRNVVAINDLWLISLDESETKTRAPLELIGQRTCWCRSAHISTSIDRYCQRSTDPGPNRLATRCGYLREARR